VDYGWGALVSFARGTGYIYEQHKNENVLFFNAFEDSGINAETADKYLEDGVHLTPAGNRIYAEYISRILNKDFRPEE
jgi:lysophospholipase L1-like esterase